MADEITIEGSPGNILGKLTQAGVPRNVIECLSRKAILGPEKNAQTWKCKRTRVLCEDENPGSTTGRKYGFSVTCTVTYDDGSTGTIDESYGC